MPTLDTQITAVTVYPDRARLRRRGSLRLEAGLHTLEVAGLPVSLDPDSLRASARGTARARLLGVQARRTFFAETPVEEVQALEAQIEALQDEMAGLEARAGLLINQRAHLEALAAEADTYALALASGERSLETQLGLYEGVRKEGERIEGELRETAAQRREAERRLQKLQAELNQKRSSRPRQRFTAEVEVEILEGGELALELVYVVSGAGWKPLYDLRLLENGGEGSGGSAPLLEVSYLGQVTQKTGEAWEGVSLALSTARPALAGRLPELPPWFLRPYAPPVLRKQPEREVAVRMATLAAAAPAALDAGAPVEELEAELPGAQVESSGMALNYNIPGNVSLPSDGEPHKVTIARLSLLPRLDYVSAPKLTPAAYRRVRVTNDSPYVFLPGAANLFAGDEFLGTAGIELAAPGAELELYLGVDDRLRVERELKRRDVDKTLIGGRRKVHFAYEITLENLLPHEARVLLHDQLPVPGHEDIKVRLESSEPRPATHSELNLLDWELILPPGQKRGVRFDFTVEYPQGMEITGL
jgi:uncharacterized protein (TIGR02231 family)